MPSSTSNKATVNGVYIKVSAQIHSFSCVRMLILTPRAIEGIPGQTNFQGFHRAIFPLCFLVLPLDGTLSLIDLTTLFFFSEKSIIQIRTQCHSDNFSITRFDELHVFGGQNLYLKDSCSVQVKSCSNIF